MFSFLGYAFTDEPGRELKCHRDFWNFANEDHIFTFAIELANRGFFPQWFSKWVADFYVLAGMEVCEGQRQ